MNKSGVRPVGRRVLILPDQTESKTESGIILGTGTQLDREALAQMYGVVVAMGEDCYDDQKSSWCAVGDRVSFGKYSGLIYIGVDDKKYRMVNDLDIVAQVEEGVK